jgi:hypothetical protein
MKLYVDIAVTTQYWFSSVDSKTWDLTGLHDETRELRSIHIRQWRVSSVSVPSVQWAGWVLLVLFKIHAAMFLCRTPHGRHWHGTDTELTRHWYGTDTALIRNRHVTDTELTRHWYGTDTELTRHWYGTDMALIRNWHVTDTELISVNRSVSDRSRKSTFGNKKISRR